MQRIPVLFPLALGCYDYTYDTPLPVGTFVHASLGKKKLLGVVWDKKTDENFPESKLKTITDVLPIPPLPYMAICLISLIIPSFLIQIIFLILYISIVAR